MKLALRLLIGLALLASSAAAQTPIPFTPGRTQTAPDSNQDTPNALQTREMFRQLVRQYSPTLSEVFRLDPALLTNQAFLAPYPRLAEFLGQHPEIAHNPRFYVGESYGNIVDTPEERSYEMFEIIMNGFAIFTAGAIVLSVFSWLVKTVIDHRRWVRLSKVQSEVHSKLLDRFTSNQDLLAYVQTPAGRHFLESAPLSIDPASRAMGPPAGRIIFSVQAGIVLALAGVGMHIVSWAIPLQEVAQPLFVVGMLALAVGVGFVLSAVAAYMLSRRLGLLDQTPLASRGDNPGVSPPHA